MTDQPARAAAIKRIRYQEGILHRRRVRHRIKRLGWKLPNNKKAP